MTIYQFVIELIPRAWFEKNKNEISELLHDAEGYNTSIAWEAGFESGPIECILSTFLPSGKTWHEDLKTWGSEEYSDIQLWKKNKNIESIKIRFDLRSDAEGLKEKIIAFSKEYNYVFYIPSTKGTIDPDIGELNNVISKSKAAKFVENPEKFLNEID